MMLLIAIKTLKMELSSKFTENTPFGPNNMVIVARWEEEVNLDSAFLALPIVPVESSFPNKKKIKIPYFGVEDIIVSIRYKRRARGIRFVPKQPDNFVSIDLQTGNRNAHIKLSSKNALVMGVTSLEEGIIAVECLIQMISMTDDHLAYLKNATSAAYKNAFDYITSLAKEGTVGMQLPDVDMFINKMDSFCNKNGVLLDKRLCMILLVRAYELSSITELGQIMEEMKDCHIATQNKLEIVTAEVPNSAYNYKLNFNRVGANGKKEEVKGAFVLKNLANAILNLKNPHIIPSHHNWYAKYVNVVVSTHGIKNGELLMEGDPDTQHIHRFNISETSSIRMWASSDVQEAWLVHLLLRNIIEDIVNKNKDVFIVSQSPA